PDRPDAVDRFYAERDAEIRAGWRRLRWLAAACAALFGTAFLAVVYCDLAPPDLSDFEVPPLAVPEQDNAYLALRKLGAELVVAPLIREDEPDDPPAPLPDPEEPDDAEEAFDTTAGLFGGENHVPLRERLQRGESWTPERVAKWRPALD